MKDKGRDYLPALAGEFLPETEIRARAREHFLMVVTATAPAPLYSLRDHVFPRFQAAFHREIDLGKSLDDLKSLCFFSLLDSVLPGETADLRSLPEYGLWRKSVSEVYAAIEDLAQWGMRFNLIGEPAALGQNATTEVVNLARMDYVWPLVVALETVLQWHFLRGRAIETLGGVPLFRSKKFPDPPKLEDLPPIQLRTVLYDPRASIAKEILDRLMPDRPPLADPREVNTPAWQIQWEPKTHFRERALKDFKSWLNRYVTDCEGAARSAGLVKGPGKRELSHFVWAAKYQVGGDSADAIAKTNRYVTRHAVEKAVLGILDLIKLVPRNPKPGRRPARAPIASPPRTSPALAEILRRLLAEGARNSE